MNVREWNLNKTQKGKLKLDSDKLLQKALNELKSWNTYDRSVNEPENQRQETVNLIEEIEQHFQGKN